jgi:asparagine synthase (glutamine-hydrolysing)
MFAFGLWDSKQRQLLLARDPLGIKALYYADDGWTIRFASSPRHCWQAVRSREIPIPARHRRLPTCWAACPSLSRMARIPPCPPAPPCVDAAGPSAAALLRRRPSLGARAAGGRRRRGAPASSRACTIPSAITWWPTFRSPCSSRPARFRGAAGTMGSWVARDSRPSRCLREFRGTPRRGAARRRVAARYARAMSCTVDRASSSATCRRSSMRWTCRPSTASTPGSSPRRRARRASRSP